MPFSLKDWTDEEFSNSVLADFDQKIKDHIIDRVEDVAADGHCGYRCCAELLGLSSDDGWKTVWLRMLLELQINMEFYIGILGDKKRCTEIESALDYFKTDSVPKKNWMQVPDMGCLFAAAFNCVFCVLSPQQYMTYLPLRLRPQKEIKIVQMVLIDNCHFMKFYWKEGAPIPYIYPAWEYHHCEAASDWGNEVSKLIDKWDDLVGYPPKKLPSIQSSVIDLISVMNEFEG